MGSDSSCCSAWWCDSAGCPDSDTTPWLDILLLTHICKLYDLINMFNAINQSSMPSWAVKLLKALKFMWKNLTMCSLLCSLIITMIFIFILLFIKVVFFSFLWRHPFLYVLISAFFSWRQMGRQRWSHLSNNRTSVISVHYHHCIRWILLILRWYTSMTICFNA